MSFDRIRNRTDTYSLDGYYYEFTEYTREVTFIITLYLLSASVATVPHRRQCTEGVVAADIGVEYLFIIMIHTLRQKLGLRRGLGNCPSFLPTLFCFCSY